MSDNLRRYRAIRDALTQWYPGQPTGTVARHLTTLAALISGIVGSKSTQLPSVATKIPDGAKPGEPCQTLDQMARQRAYLGGGVFLPYVDIFIDAVSSRDACGGHGWQCRRPWLPGADAPRGL